MDGDPLAKAMDRIRLIGRLFFITCWPRIEMCGASSFMRNFLVEVFTVVKVNLDLFKGKIAGKRSKCSLALIIGPE